jgi:hypothetical protein
MEGMGKLMTKKEIPFDSIKFLTMEPAIGKNLEFKEISEFHTNH